MSAAFLSGVCRAHANRRGPPGRPTERSGYQLHSGEPNAGIDLTDMCVCTRACIHRFIHGPYIYICSVVPRQWFCIGDTKLMFLIETAMTTGEMFD